MQVAAERVGRDGRVVGLDLVAIDPLPHAHAMAIVGDLSDPSVIAAAREGTRGAADVVLSDAAPKLSGVRARDQAQCEALAAAVLEAVPRLLAPGGALVMKTFMGAGLDEVRKRLQEIFRRVQVVRPTSTRAGSSECYVVALAYRP
jgi:23S rRNA (uridine2552-2'-O)-methyltransferase